MRMKTLPICPALTHCCWGLCSDKPAQFYGSGGRHRDSTNVGYALSRCSPDIIYPSAPEVVRCDRYRLVDISFSQAQLPAGTNSFICVFLFAPGQSRGCATLCPCGFRISSVHWWTANSPFIIVCRYPLFIIRRGSIRLNVALQILLPVRPGSCGWCNGSVLPTFVRNTRHLRRMQEWAALHPSLWSLPLSAAVRHYATAGA